MKYQIFATENIQDKALQSAYKVIIEPFQYDGSYGSEFDNLEKLSVDAINKINMINDGYSKIYGEKLVTNKAINWETCTIIADMESEDSLTFNYNADWGESDIADLLGGFIPNSVNSSVGRTLTKTGALATKAVAGTMTYGGSFPAANFNGKKVLAKPQPLSYNVRIRVMDKMGDGAVLKTMTKLLAYSVPMTSDMNVPVSAVINAYIGVGSKAAKVLGEVPGISTIKNLVNGVSEFGDRATPDRIKQAMTASGEALNGVTQPIGDVAGEVADDGVNAIGNVVTTFGEEFTGFTPRFELISSPVPIRIFISDYFIHSAAVIKSVGVNLSKQINTEGYPIMGTFDLSIEAREQTTLDLGASNTNNPNANRHTLRNIVFASKNIRNEVFKPHIYEGK